MHTFKKQILTKEIAYQLGHVAWIEDSNPKTAIQKMFDAVKTSPINCAVWVDANVQFENSQIDAVAEWRQEFHYGFTGTVSKQHKPDQISFVLDDSFEKAYIKPSSTLECTGTRLEKYQKGLENLKDIIKTRTETIIDALKPSYITVRPKVSYMSKMLPVQNFHVDRETERVGVRFLDAVNCPHTFLTHNKNCVFNGTDYKLKDSAEIIEIFECPSNSFLLITQPNHSHAPILHSENFILSPDEERKRRTTVTYDINFS